MSISKILKAAQNANAPQSVREFVKMYRKATQGMEMESREDFNRMLDTAYDNLLREILVGKLTLKQSNAK
jgi:predicted component of type VI protein secretion system